MHRAHLLNPTINIKEQIIDTARSQGITKGLPNQPATHWVGILGRRLPTNSIITAEYGTNNKGDPTPTIENLQLGKHEVA